MVHKKRSMKRISPLVGAVDTRARCALIMLLNVSTTKDDWVASGWRRMISGAEPLVYAAHSLPFVACAQVLCKDASKSILFETLLNSSFPTSPHTVRNHVWRIYRDNNPQKIHNFRCTCILPSRIDISVQRQYTVFCKTGVNRETIRPPPQGRRWSFSLAKP